MGAGCEAVAAPRHMSPLLVGGMAEVLAHSGTCVHSYTVVQNPPLELVVSEPPGAAREIGNGYEMVRSISLAWAEGNHSPTQEVAMTKWLRRGIPLSLIVLASATFSVEATPCTDVCYFYILEPCAMQEGGWDGGEDIDQCFDYYDICMGNCGFE